MFESLDRLITNEPLKTESVAFRTLVLIENICSESPVLTEKMRRIIERFLAILCHS